MSFWATLDMFTLDLHQMLSELEGRFGEETDLEDLYKLCDNDEKSLQHILMETIHSYEDDLGFEKTDFKAERTLCTFHPSVIQRYLSQDY